MKTDPQAYREKKWESIIIDEERFIQSDGVLFIFINYSQTHVH